MIGHTNPLAIALIVSRHFLFKGLASSIITAGGASFCFGALIWSSCAAGGAAELATVLVDVSLLASSGSAPWGGVDMIIGTY